MSGVASRIYQAVFRRTSTFALTIVLSAFLFERTVDVGADWIFETVNRGKLWHHIKEKYAAPED